MKTIIVTAIIAVVVMSAFGMQTAHASGFSDGYNIAKSDVRYGLDHHACSFDFSELYCADYNLGYSAGLAAANLLHK